MFWVGQMTAQVTETTEGGDIEQTLNTLFQNVNLSQAPTGIFMNKAVYFANIHNYDGTIVSDSTDVNINTFGWLYTMMGMAKVGTNDLPDATVLYAGDIYNGNGAIPLVMMCERYNHFKTTIFDNNLIRYINNQLYDVGKRIESPYTEDTVFVVTPVVNTSTTNSVSFVLTSDRIVQNVGNFQSISIDFGTGNGFQTIIVGQPFTVSLASGMNRPIMQIQCNDGRILKCRFEINVEPTVFSPRSGGLDDIYRRENSLTQTFTAFHPQASKVSTAEVTTFYACSDNVLRKPLIILDGFNTGSSDDANVDAVTTQVFLDFFNLYKNTPTSIGLDRPLTQDLRNEGYDLIFVNWQSEGGRDNIRYSAYLLQQIIASINTQKAINNSNEKNVLIGISMGGVIGKFALLDLERQNPNAANGGHDMKLFIGFDAPMQGANIPLGFQYLVKDLGDDILFGVLGKNSKGLRRGLIELKSPAARQLLTYSAFASNPKSPADFNSLYDELNGMGKLQKCDYKTISNGSMVGTPNFNAGKFLLITNGYSPLNTRVVLSMSLSVNTLPLTSSTSKNIYSRTIKIDIPFVNITFSKIINVSNMRPLDGAPGGTTGLTGGLEIPVLRVIKGVYDDGNHEYLQTTFIPTVSALDIKSPEGQNVFFDVSNEQSLINNQLVGSTGMVGSRSSAQFDAAVFIDFPVNRIPNQTHSGLSYRNTGFLLYELLSKNPLHTSSNVTLNNRTYNFGRSIEPYPLNPPSPGNFVPKGLNNIIDYTVNVENTGQLWVNRSGIVGFMDIATNPTNATNTDFSLIIQKGVGCGGTNDGVVNVRNNGIVRVGHASTTNTANIKIREGGTLRVQNLGSLFVELGASIDIERGGKLILEAGANLNLTGANTKINIKEGGQLIVNAGANINLLGANSKIVVEFFSELVLNGNFNFAGGGWLQFDPGHILTVNSDLELVGWSKTSKFFVLSDASSSSQNILRITGHSFSLSNALVLYGTNTQMDIINSPEIELTDVFFSGNTTFKALNIVNSPRVDIRGCNFTYMTEGVVIEGNSNVMLNNNSFAGVKYGASFKGISSIEVQMLNCTFDFNSYPITSGIACKFENAFADFTNNVFIGLLGADITAIELKNTTGFYAGFTNISNFKTGISAEKMINANVNLWGSEISNCEIGINSIGNRNPDGTLRGYVLMQNCTKLINNQIGVKGENVEILISDGNVFQNTNNTNSLLFDICYNDPLLLGNIYASNNFWVSGFANTKFNLINNCPSGTRRKLTSFNDLTIQCASNQFSNGCGLSPLLSDGNGSITIGSPIQCRIGNNTLTREASTDIRTNVENHAQSDEWDKGKFSLSPNPATEEFEVVLANGDYDIQVFDALGKRVFTKNTEGVTTVDVRTWHNGIYIVNLLDKVSKKKTFSKVVVQH